MKHRRFKRNSGYTLVELMVAMVCISLIFGGVMTMLMVVLTSSFRAQNVVLSGSDAALAAGKIIEASREARIAVLPNDPQFVSPPLGSSVTTTSGGNTFYTCLMLVLPARQTAQPARLMTETALASNQPALYDRNNSGTTLWFYRSDSNGTPNPSSGQYLWEAGTDSYGNAINRYIVRTLPTDVPNAVDFQIPSASLTNEIAFKVTTQWLNSWNKGTAVGETNEASNGATTTTISGQCVMVRDNGGTNAVATNTTGHWSATSN